MVHSSLLRYFRITFIIIATLSTSAFSDTLRPKYCANYPNALSDIKRESYSAKKTIYNSCIDGNSLEIDITQATNALAGIQKHTANNIGIQFQKRLNVNALKSILDKREAYFGIHKDLDTTISKSLKECAVMRSNHMSENYDPEAAGALSKHLLNIENEKFDINKQRDILLLNIINAVKAKSLIDKNKDYHSQMERYKDDLDSLGNKCFYQQRKCKDEVGFLESNRNCRRQRSACDKSTIKKSKNIEKKIEELNNQISPLYSLVQTSPLLFQSSNDDNIFAIFQADRLLASPLLEKIADNISPEIFTEMQEALDSNDTEKLDRVYLEHSDYLRSIIKDKKLYGQLNQASEKEIEKELERLDAAATALCQGEGHNLHHYPNLVAETMNDMFKNAPDGMLDRRITIAQMAYCNLLDTNPIESTGISISAISGFSMLGAGLIMQVIPVAGTAVGTGLMVTGGSILTIKGFKELYDSDIKLTKEIGLHSSGLLGYEKLLQSKETRNTNLAWSVADTVLLPFDLHALRTLRGGGKVASINTSRINKTVDIKEHKEGTFLERLISNLPGVGPSPKKIGLNDQFSTLKELNIAKQVSKDLGKTKHSIDNLKNGKIIHGLSEENDIPLEVISLIEKSITDQRTGSLKGLSLEEKEIVISIRKAFPNSEEVLEKLKQLKRSAIRTDDKGIEFVTGVPEIIKSSPGYKLIYKGTSYAGKTIISKSQIGKSIDKIPRGDKEFLSFSDGKQHGVVELSDGISVSTDASIATYYGTDVVIYKVPNDVFNQLPAGDPTLGEKVFKYMIPDEYRVMTMDKKTMIRYNALNK